MNKYILNMVSVHEKRIDVVGIYDTYEDAEKALNKDVDETANGWGDVPCLDIYVENFEDGTAKVIYEDETFIWAINEI